MTRRFTLVAFHAHPDDETLLTGGTLARAAAEGHRVVLVVATLGEAGGTGGTPLAARRRAELHAAAAELGCARVAELGYRDSGLRGDAAAVDGAPPRFVDVPVEAAAAGLSAILRDEQADVLTGYDPHGGYGHPDHRQVHRVARLAAELAGTPVLLEATVDRNRLRIALAVLRLTGRLLPRLPLGAASDVFTPRSEITHIIDVRRYLGQKRAALHAHTSQADGGRGLRTVALLGHLPGPLFSVVAGREWFRATGPAPGRRPVTGVFDTLR